jgi:hypothetical protein
MLARRLLTSLALLLVVGGITRAQDVNLTEAPLADQCFKIELSMELKGNITVQQQGQTVSFPHEAGATHTYLERVLEAEHGVANKTARHYQTAEASISFNKKASKRALRPERAFMVAHRTKDRMLVFSPRGALTREEMEVTEHFDTLFVAGLVPGKTAAVGETWKLGTAVAVALCDLDGLTEHDLSAKLDAVKDGLAVISVTGTASGIALGAQVKMLVNARCEFDTKAQRVVGLEWKQSDQRQQGPISPALSADVVVKLKRTPIAEPKELSKFALVPVPTGPAPVTLTNLHYRDPRGRFEFQHGRDWHVVSPEDSSQLVLRLMDRGDFIAQATLTPWKKVDPKGVIGLDEFKDLMAETPGWEEEQVLEKTKVDVPNGHTVYRVTASGTLDRVKAVQSFYLVASAQGEQMIVTFSVVPTQVQKLEARDLDLVRSITFPGAAVSAPDASK